MDVFNAKQNARNKHKSSQSKKKHHGPKRGGKMKQVAKVKTPQNNQPSILTIDQLISFSPNDAENENLIDTISAEVDPLSKDFKHLITLGMKKRITQTLQQG